MSARMRGNSSRTRPYEDGPAIPLGRRGQRFSCSCRTCGRRPSSSFAPQIAPARPAGSRRGTTSRVLAAAMFPPPAGAASICPVPAGRGGAAIAGSGQSMTQFLSTRLDLSRLQAIRPAVLVDIDFEALLVGAWHGCRRNCRPSTCWAWRRTPLVQLPAGRRLW